MSILFSRLVAVLAAATMVATGFIGCSAGCSTGRDGEPSDRGGATSITRLPEPDDALSEELILGLAQAKNFHHKAEVYLADGNLAEATAAVRQILSVPFPADAPEADDVRLDARARLAKLLVAQGKVDDAMSIVDEGVAAARRDSFFLANLYTVKGEVHEAQAVLLDDAGPDAKARASDARRDAIRAYDRSIAINEALQRRLLDGREGDR